MIDEKDEEELDAAQGRGAVGNRFMMSRAPDSDTSIDTGTIIGDRYKDWSRSQRSDPYVKPVMAGGERARGAGTYQNA